MASSESDEITSRVETQEPFSKPRNPFLSLVPKFPFGFFNRGRGDGGKVDVVIKKESSAAEEEEYSRTSAKPDVVTFRLSEPKTEPLKIESEEPEKSSNPIFIWQIYALGGFILVKWAWAKWQERQANAKRKDDDPTEDQSPNEDTDE